MNIEKNKGQTPHKKEYPNAKDDRSKDEHISENQGKSHPIAGGQS